MNERGARGSLLVGWLAAIGVAAAQQSSEADAARAARLAEQKAALKAELAAMEKFGHHEEFLAKVAEILGRKKDESKEPERDYPSPTGSCRSTRSSRSRAGTSRGGDASCPPATIQSCRCTRCRRSSTSATSSARTASSCSSWSSRRAS